MKSVRDTGIMFPSTLSSDEKCLKEIFEKLRTIRKAIASTNKMNVNTAVGDNLKIERKTSKRHLQQAEEATEEVRRKVLIGAVSFKKADEKKDSFKRSSLIGRRRDSDKTKTDSDTVINSNTELLTPNVDNGNNKSLSLDDHSETGKKSEEAPDSFDIHESPIDFGTEKNDVSNVLNIRKSESSSASQRISTGGTYSNSSDACISPTSDTFDTCKAQDDSSSFDNCRPISLSDCDDFDTSGPYSSFNMYKPTSIGDDETDNYKPRSVQQLSLNATSGSSSSIGFEQLKPCKGPCLYIRGYDLVADFLQNVFNKFGVINRVFVEERQKSAFITYATTEEAEAAIKEMDGNMVNGITLRVSFARRQNQCGISENCEDNKSFDRSNSSDGRDYSNRSQEDEGGRFRSNERIRFRSEKSRRSHGRGRTCGDSLLSAASAETDDNFRSGSNKVSSDESTVQASRDNDFWLAERQSAKRMDGPSVGKDDDDFDTYKSTVSPVEGDDLNVINKKDDDFDTYKPFSNDGRSDSSSNHRKSFGKRRDNFEHLRGGKRGGFCSDRNRNFRGNGRDNRNRGGSSWRSRKRSNELRHVDYCSTGNLGIDKKGSLLTGDENRDKDSFRTSDDHASEHSKSDSTNRESESRGNDNDSKDDFWPASNRSNNEGDESCPFSVERSSSGQSFRGSTRRNYRKGRRSGNRGEGFRRRRRNIGNKSTWSDEEGKSSCYDEWPDVDNKLSSLTSAGDKMPNSPPPPPCMSEVQVAWSEATKKTSKEMAVATKKEEITIMQRKLEIRKQVSYDEDDPFA
ncbi:RNA recognition motif family protein [Acanthocheilonema viteae]